MENWKPQEYCSQPRKKGEGCETCSLTNYGKDCRNNLLQRAIWTPADGWIDEGNAPMMVACVLK